MVNYLPSQATTQITVAALNVATTLSISAPATSTQGQTFNVSGILIRNDTGLPIPNATIDVRFNGSPFGSGTTGVDGDYLIIGSIPTEGTFTLTADYAGETRPGLTLLPSFAKTGVALIDGITPYLPIIIPAVIIGWLLLSKK